MTNQKKSAPVAKPAAAPKPAKKLIPRTAPKPEAVAVAAVAELAAVETPAVPSPAVAAASPEVPATAAATAKVRTPRPARKPTKEDETVARHQKVLAEALEMAQAINYDQPKLMQQAVAQRKDVAKNRKAAKLPKAKKVKLIRDCFAMPEAEYAQIGELKKRLAGIGAESKKSEVVRAGIAVLAALNDAELTAVMGRIARIKTGRPAK